MSDQDYFNLTPDTVLDAIESIGVELDGSMLTLNSYENRVYRIIDLEGNKLVAKFYRPNRWSNDAILEEHAFSQQLADAEIPVVPPLKLKDNKTIFEWNSFRFSLFECHGGRAPELDDEQHLLWLGRYMARIHNIGALQEFKHRPNLDVATFGHDSLNFLSEGTHIPVAIKIAYETIASQVLEASEQVFSQFDETQIIRTHCDCHPGNILWTEQGPHIVDLDDSRNAPAIQDLWMLLGGDAETMNERLEILLDGYQEFRDFDYKELNLIEPLRSLRMIHYSAWLARRWVDPSFQHHFPWFAEERYWENQILGLKEQLADIYDPPVKNIISGNF